MRDYMKEKIRVAVFGLGHMGSGMTKLLLEKEGFELVGAYDPWKAGETAGERKDIAGILGLESPTGIQLSSNLDEMLASARPDIVLQATGSTMKHAAPEMEAALEAGAHIITICEEASYPWYGSPDIAARLDSLAKERGRTILGTGINPGFVLDFLAIALTGVCRRVDKIKATRINDLSPYGFNVLKTQGVNLSKEAFEEGIENGSVVGHFGFPESMSMIAAALGWEIGRIEQRRLPIISTVERDGGEAGVIKPGYTAGCNHTGIAYDKEGTPIIELYHPQQVHPELEGEETGDYIEIYGEPDIKLSSGPEIPGGVGTTALAVNMIPKVLQAKPGFKTMVDLPPPSAIMTDARRLFTQD
ncbi:MAG: 2,4-diaminopentanoate dehydrogenase [Spirochaetaceae bacterium]